MLELIIELENMIQEHKGGVRNERWIEEMISILYEELAREEAERKWDEWKSYYYIGFLILLFYLITDRCFVIIYKYIAYIKVKI